MKMVPLTVLMPFALGTLPMHRVGSAGNTTNSSRPRKEKRLTYVLNDADDTKVWCISSPFIDSPNHPS